jgi:hypothetical protein
MTLTLGGCQQPLVRLGLLVVLKIKLEKFLKIKNNKNNKNKNKNKNIYII